MNRIRGLLAALLCLALIPGPLPAGGTAGAEEGKALFTLLIYMTGSSLESQGFQASEDLREMTGALDTEGIRILVQTGGASAWKEDIRPEKSTRIEILPGEWTRLAEEEDRNMGDAETLRDFLKWGYAFAPAERYGLILWDHGAGPLLGVCFDERHPDAEGAEDGLSMKELERALGESPFAGEKLEWIGFDACLMCTLEVADLVSPYARYMIASQETESEEGWPYEFLRGMPGRESGEAWGRRIVTAYGREEQRSAAPRTLSCLDLSRMDRVRREMGRFFGNLTETVLPETYAGLTRCRLDTRSFGNATTSSYDLIDLTDLIRSYEREGLADGKELRAALGDLILQTCPENDSQIHGISIYYPFDNKSRYISPWGPAYQELSFSPEYRGFLRRISDYYLGDALFNRDSDYQAEIHEEGGRARLEMPLTEEEAAGLARARLIVLEKLASDSYRLVYYDDQRIRASDRSVSARYKGEALYAVGADQEILAGPISYFPVENGAAVYGILYSGFHADPVRLVYQMNESGRMELTQVLASQSGADGMFLPSPLDPAECDEIQLLSFGPQNVESEETVTSLQFSVYYPGGTVSLDPRDPDWTLAFLPEANRNERVAYLRLTDVRGETSFSEVVRLPNYNHIPVAGETEAGLTGRIGARLRKGVLVTGYDAGLLFTVELTNGGTEPVRADAARVLLDGREAGRIQAYEMNLEPGKTGEIDVFVPLAELREMELPEDIRQAEILFTLRKEDGTAGESGITIPVEMNASVFRVGAEEGTKRD